MTGTGHGSARPTRGGPDIAVAVAAVAAMILTYGLIVLGSTVRVTGSGMGCPSWPLCYGRFGPVDQYNALWEQSHRYLVTVVTVVIALTTVLAWRSARRRAALAPALVSVGFIVVQAALGAITVFAHNAPWTVAVHLIVGLMFFGTTIVTAVVAVASPRISWSPRLLGPWDWAALVGVLVLVTAGTIVVGTGAGDDCPSWPLCTHSAPASMIAWQLTHRVVAGAVAVAIVGFVASHWRRGAGPRWRAGGVGLVVLLVLTGAIGAATALVKATAGWQDLHLAFAAALWGVLVILVMTAIVAAAPPAPATPPADGGPPAA